MANVVADGARRNRRLFVGGDLDDAQLREVKAHDWCEHRVSLLHDRVAPGVTVVVGGSAVEAVEGLADVAEDLVNHVGRVVGAPDLVRHDERLLLLGAELVDVIDDLVVGDTLLVDIDQVVPDVRVATVLCLLLEDLGAGNLVGLALLRADDKPIDILDARDALLASAGVRVHHKQVVQLVSVVDSLALGVLVAREHVEELGIVLAQLLGVVHHVVVLVVHEKEPVRLVGRKVLDEGLAVEGVLGDSLVEHLAVGLGRVKVARIVDVRDGRSPEVPHLFVVVHVNHRALVRHIDDVRLLRLQEVLIERQALRNLVGERDDDVLPKRLLDVDDDAARLVVQILEVGDVGALVGVVEEDERLGLEDLLDLEHRVKVLHLEVVLEVLQEVSLALLLRDSLEHLENVREVGGVHLNQAINQMIMLSYL